MAVRLATPRLSVVVSVDADAAVIVQTTGGDMVAAEAVARRHNWGPIAESPMTWLSFLAWRALKRAGSIPDTVTYEAFRESVGSIADAPAAPDDDGAGDDAGLPTLPGPGPG